MKYKIFFVLVAFTLTACASSSEEPSTPIDPDAPVLSPSTSEPMETPSLSLPDDSKFVRGNIFIEESGLVIRESFPPQISLNLSGNLPTPCHQFRANINKPDEQNRINVDVYTVVDPNMMCIQVLKEFSESVNLGTYPSGHYSVWVNGESVGEFDS